jgi:hypothetical protein
MRQQQQKSSFRSEAQLVRRFVGLLNQQDSPWTGVQTIREWDYRTGITDVLVRNGRNELIAFEAKLTDWRRACYQAYRTTSFALRAYVVLPEEVAQRAYKYGEFFTRFGVGLCACSSRRLSVLLEAQPAEPIMEWLTEKAHATFDGIFNAGTTRSRGQCRTRLQTA